MIQRSSQLAILALVLSQVSFAQTLEVLQSQWAATFDALKSGNAANSRAAFAQFNNSLKAYLLKNHRDWKMEYLAGSLDCQFAANKSTGAELLQDVLQTNRSLNENGRSEVRKVLQQCNAVSSPAQTESPPLPVNVTLASVHYDSPGVSGNTKQGALMASLRASGVTTDLVPVTEAVLQQRLHTIETQQEAKTQAETLLGGPAQAVVHNHFVVATTGGTTASADSIGSCLDRYVAPLQQQFGIAPNQYLVTVYAARSLAEVYTLARHLHGLQFPSGVLAYSVTGDMSLVSAGSGTGCGSMAHELVHLWIRPGFADPPPWLEEGIASEVAIATLAPTGFQFGWSWRDEILRGSAHPSIAALLSMSWSDLNGNATYSSSVVQAEAAVFVRFLADRGRLVPVYRSVRENHVSEDLSSVQSYPDLLQAELGLSMSGIQAEFDRWFQAQSAANSGLLRLRPNSQGSGPEGPASGGIPACRTPEDFAALDSFEHSAGQNLPPCKRPPAPAPASVPNSP